MLVSIVFTKPTIDKIISEYNISCLSFCSGSCLKILVPSKTPINIAGVAARDVQNIFMV